MSTVYPVRTADLRPLNLERILSYLRRHPSASRSELADGTGLSRASITGLVGSLLEHGYLKEVDEALNVGRPSPKLALADGRRGVLVGELTADKFSIWLGDLAGQEIFAATAAHAGPRGSSTEVLATGNRLMRRAVKIAREEDVELVGAATIIPAPVHEGIITSSPDFGWRNVPAVQMLTVGLRDLENMMVLWPDITVGGWAEYQQVLTSESPPNTLVYLKSDIGIGGAVVSNGRPCTGDHRLAFLAGHVPVERNGALCECGRRGCFVSYAGPEATLERAGMTDLISELGLAAAMQELLRRASDNDPQCLESLQETVRWIAHFLIIVEAMYDPGIIVLGGYWAGLTDQIDTSFRELRVGSTVAGAHNGARLVPSHHGADANRVGAASKLIASHIANVTI